jgi:SAM-dependent MidA family methyltransferase
MKMPNEIIHEEIRKNGVLSFARFMELALYCPETGYYETEKDKVGRRGDFITSVSTGSLFGELLALQFAEWLGELTGQNRPLKILEAGAHDGRLAADILGWLQNRRPELYSEIEYVLLEPSVRRQGWQRETLEQFGSSVRWVASFQDPTIQQFNGIIFSNELLDAFPIHRFGWDARQRAWFEWGVESAGEHFEWTKIPRSVSPLRIQCAPELEAVLPDNYTVEVSPAAEAWWREAAGILAEGKLLALDYGFTADEMFLPSRVNGTLRAYSRHQVTDNVLASPGGQDLTAHVNFTAIQRAGEAVGLITEDFLTQSKFLTQILIRCHHEKSLDKSFGGWDAASTRQFQSLTHPEHMGRAFQVLIQLKP